MSLLVVGTRSFSPRELASAAYMSACRISVDPVVWDRVVGGEQMTIDENNVKAMDMSESLVHSRSVHLVLLTRLLAGHHTIPASTIKHLIAVFHDPNPPLLCRTDIMSSLTFLPGIQTLLLQESTLPITALSSIVLQLGEKLSQTIDAAVSLTCEALHAHLYNFEGHLYEKRREMRSVVDNIRLMVDGSHLCVTGKKKPEKISSVSTAPYSHAPLRRELEGLKRVVTDELNTIYGSSSIYHLITPLFGLLSALKNVSTSSYLRCKEMVTTHEELSGIMGICDIEDFEMKYDDSLQSGVDVCFLLLDILTRSERIVSTEIMCAVLLIRKEEEMGLEKKRRKEKEKSEAEEKLRKEMEAKGKVLKTKKKKGSDRPVVILGKGTREFYNLILSIGDITIDNISSFMSSSEYTNGLQEILDTTKKNRKPKIPKGTRDFLPSNMALREKAFNTIIHVFKRHGAVTIDTPVFELRETLMGKYGEDSKLIYDLSDQGGELLSLRYDLTVPFARFVAMNNCPNITRYQIARVYRRDQPVMSKGRYREFYQCDFDIAGNYSSMMPDAEVLRVLTEILDELDLGSYFVKINHRKLLDAMMSVCGVPSVKFRTICSAIDKLDKESWEKVREEMVVEKGLSEESADMIGEFVKMSGKCRELSELLKQKSELMNNSYAIEAIRDLDQVFMYTDAMNVTDKLLFDMSLARGLDYYTGLIYEAVLTDEGHVGTIAAGGRYDGLVGMFMPGGKQVPAVGVSLGIERVLAVMSELEKRRERKVRTRDTSVLVASAGNEVELSLERMRICSEMWDNCISAEFIHSDKPKMKKQIEYALDNSIPVMVVIGSDEVKRGVVKVKDVEEKTEEEVLRSDLVAFMKKKLSR